MPGKLEGKVAFITGAARGQGRAHAIAMAREGADIIAVDICRDIESNPYPLATPDDLAETERSIKELGRRVVARVGDVRERHELRDALEAGVAHNGTPANSMSWKTAGRYEFRYHSQRVQGHGPARQKGRQKPS